MVYSMMGLAVDSVYHIVSAAITELREAFCVMTCRIGLQKCMFVRVCFGAVFSPYGTEFGLRNGDPDTHPKGYLPSELNRQPLN